MNEIAIIYYIIIAASCVLVVRETKSRIITLVSNWKGVKFASITIAILMVYALVIYQYVDVIPILNWGWLGYNIALGPLGDQGFLGILPFVPILIYMLMHLNYYEEFYFRKNKKLVVLWAFLHIAMGVQIHVVFVLLPVGFIYKYIYDKYGLNNAYSVHFTTNIFLVFSILAAYALEL
uniref:Abortive infection protein n=2 Tax=environmental samples TaxID=651140 RepID=A0A075GXJ0_9ARCH|nr:hypothetical protein [uncultured marine thaumarchaeote KM3_31_E07]AIF08581.1 hypothetical protein [uncultured marine thaumarchaeote KM3_31_F07]